MDGKVVADMVHETTHSTFELLKAVDSWLIDNAPKVAETEFVILPSIKPSTRSRLKFCQCFGFRSPNCVEATKSITCHYPNKYIILNLIA